MELGSQSVWITDGAHIERTKIDERFLRHGDGVDLDQGALGQGGRLERDPGRLVVAEELGVDFVHVGEICHVLQKDGATHHMGAFHFCLVKNGVNILEALHCLFLDTTRNERTSGRIDRDLSGDEEHPVWVNLDRLAIRPDCRRSLVRIDCSSHSKIPPHPTLQSRMKKEKPTSFPKTVRDRHLIFTIKNIFCQ